MAEQKTELRTYMLVEETKPTAPIGIQVSKNERVRINKRPSHAAFLQCTFTDRNGKNRTARLKLNSNTIWLDEQIKHGIPANEKFTAAERKAVRFVNEILMTNNKMVQEYLETIPQFEGFVGEAPNGERTLYRRYDKAAEIKSQNADFLKKLKAGNAIAEMDLEKAQNTLILIHGTAYTLPTTLEEAQTALVEHMEESDMGVDDILKYSASKSAPMVDDETRIIVGRLVDAGIVSFDDVPNAVVRKRGDKNTILKEISSEHAPEERERMFIEFLNTDEGKTLKNDLRKALKDFQN